MATQMTNGHSADLDFDPELMGRPSLGTNEMINLSLKCDKYEAVITSADAQASFKGGISLLVTGVLTGEDATKKMFTQSFFLAPQDSGYFVLNDIFRYVERSVDRAEDPANPEPEEAVVETVPEGVLSEMAMLEML